MKKIEFGQALSILANVGVIIGIVFLGIEIRDSNNQASVASRIAYTGQLTEFFSQLGTDAESEQLYRRGLIDYVQLSENEKSRFDYLVRTYLFHLTTAAMATDAGLGYTGSSYEARNMELLFEREGFRQWWAVMDRRTLPGPTVQFLEQYEAAAP